MCNPYNADFDGDEMNLHVPQTEEARAEARELMGVKHNLATPKNGTSIIAAIQDFITGAYLISQKDRFLTRAQFMQVVSWMYDGLEVQDPLTGEKDPVSIPYPAIMKPQRLWTGKQVWTVLMKPHKQYPVDVNLEAKGKQFLPPDQGSVYSDNDREKRKKAKGRKAETEKEYQARLKRMALLAPDITENDSYLVVRNSEVMCGAMDKANNRRWQERFRLLRYPPRFRPGVCSRSDESTRKN